MSLPQHRREQPRWSTDYALTDGTDNGSSTSRYIQFDKNIAQMTIDRAGTNHQRSCDLTVGVAFGDQVQYLDFSPGEVQIVFVHRRNSSPFFSSGLAAHDCYPGTGPGLALCASGVGRDGPFLKSNANAIVASGIVPSHWHRKPFATPLCQFAPRLRLRWGSPPVCPIQPRSRRTRER